MSEVRNISRAHLKSHDKKVPSGNCCNPIPSMNAANELHPTLGQFVIYCVNEHMHQHIALWVTLLRLQVASMDGPSTGWPTIVTSAKPASRYTRSLADHRHHQG